MELLGTSNTNFWVHGNLLEPQTLHQHSVPQPPHHLFSGLATETLHSQQVSAGQGGYGRGAYHQTPHPEQHAELHLPMEDRQFLPSLTGTPECSGQDAGVETNNPTSARKLHKADRERLRRDHLNEQFAKLAGVLDPVRPKNDKGTILAESIAAVNELRAEIARMRSEHVALADESRDLSQEKTELREEKTALESETKRLQNQLNQHTDAQNALPGWMSMDLSGLMSSSQFPYPLSVPPPLKSTLSLKESTQEPTTEHVQRAAVAPAPFLSIAPPGTYMHHGYPAYGMFGSGQAGPPYMPYAHFPHAVHHPHVERPYARYPSPIHPTPVYAVPMSKSAQAKSAELPTVVTDLQLQMPGVPPSSTVHQSAQVTENSKKDTFRGAGAALDVLGDSGAAVLRTPPTGTEQFVPQLSLSSSSITA